MIPYWVLQLAGEVYRAAARFSRKKSPEQELEDMATWDHGHYGNPCVVCGAEHPLEREVCPGPPATQAARAKLKK